MKSKFFVFVFSIVLILFLINFVLGAAIPTPTVTNTATPTPTKTTSPTTSPSVTPVGSPTPTPTLTGQPLTWTIDQEEYTDEKGVYHPPSSYTIKITNFFKGSLPQFNFNGPFPFDCKQCNVNKNCSDFRKGTYCNLVKGSPGYRQCKDTSNKIFPISLTCFCFYGGSDSGDSDCPKELPNCGPHGGCFKCVKDSDCNVIDPSKQVPWTKFFCKVDTGKCVECFKDLDCGRLFDKGKPYCFNNKCFAERQITETSNLSPNIFQKIINFFKNLF